MNEQNWEMLVKVADGCDLDGPRWVFSAGPTRVEYLLEVTDTQTGALRSDFNLHEPPPLRSRTRPSRPVPEASEEQALPEARCVPPRDPLPCADAAGGSACYHAGGPHKLVAAPGMIDPQERFEGLLVEMGELLQRVIARSCPKHLGLEPEDVEQEVRLRIWRLVRERARVDHPRSYLYRVAINATLDAIRIAKRRREDSLSNPRTLEAVEQASGTATGGGGRPGSAVDHRLMLSSAEDCLSGLHGRRALAVRLHLQGFTVSEIAELKGWSRASARNLVFRGLKDLRECLRTKGYSDEHI